MMHAYPSSIVIAVAHAAWLVHYSLKVFRHKFKSNALEIVAKFVVN